MSSHRNSGVTAEALGGLQGARILSVDALVALKKQSPHIDLYRASVGALRSEGTPELLVRLKTTEDPLMMWALHLVLDDREVAPCLRDAMGERSGQTDYITWLADLFWLTKRMPGHKPGHRTWTGPFKNEPGSNDWHKSALWAYRQSGRRSGHYLALALGLSASDRQPLKTMPTYTMVGNRQLLARSWQYRNAIMTHAVTHRDRSATYTPGEVTERRMAILGVSLLAGRSATRAACYLESSTGRRMSRQALTGHVEQIEVATRLKLL